MATGHSSQPYPHSIPRPGFHQASGSLPPRTSHPIPYPLPTLLPTKGAQQCCQENMSKGSNFQDYCHLILGRLVPRWQDAAGAQGGQGYDGKGAGGSRSWAHLPTSNPMPGGYIPTLETKQRECWKVYPRLTRDFDSRVHGQPSMVG